MLQDLKKGNKKKENKITQNQKWLTYKFTTRKMRPLG